MQADWLSRGSQVISTEWSISQLALQPVWQKWGCPVIDLFATHLNFKLDKFVSPFPHQQAWEVNAFSIPWSQDLLYAFPPWIIMQEVLQKIRDDKAEIILIAPSWPNRAWYPLLIQMTVEDPLPLEQFLNLLVQPHSSRVHPNLQILGLKAWRLSGSI